MVQSTGNAKTFALQVEGYNIERYTKKYKLELTFG